MYVVWLGFSEILNGELTILQGTGSIELLRSHICDTGGKSYDTCSKHFLRALIKYISLLRANSQAVLEAT